MQKYMRLCGSIINTDVITAAATGYILEMNKSALADYGGGIKITTSYAKSLPSQMNLVGSSTAKITPAEVEVVKKKFLNVVKVKVASGKIIFFNWDQTTLRLTPSSNWLMELLGSLHRRYHSTHHCLSYREDRPTLQITEALKCKGSVLN